MRASACAGMDPNRVWCDWCAAGTASALFHRWYCVCYRRREFSKQSAPDAKADVKADAAAPTDTAAPTGGATKDAADVIARANGMGLGDSRLRLQTS